jgi:predicted deacylase
VGAAPLLLERLAVVAPEHLTIRFVMDANPDGTIAATRHNRAGVDLNRNWPTADFSPGGDHGPEPLSEPETAALAADVAAFEPDVILALHATWEGPFVNYDGPGEALATAFADAAARVDDRWTTVAELDWATPGSMGTYFGSERGIPVVTVEVERYETADAAWPAVWAGTAALLAMIESWAEAAAEVTTP